MTTFIIKFDGHEFGIKATTRSSAYVQLLLAKEQGRLSQPLFIEGGVCYLEPARIS